ncbi:ABC transporter ATP-binding protein [Rhodococcoides kyotonense]|uniref:NitT/TauT family transport system ATP-binding protein n=1 Tax=Rhodococcoides kyotonense TaxID=398843 RepID=A0A239LGG6_9NOCA|nr:ABC transporter ATP-binding protein [Rhodococcus kyotonensis]SNT29390.1 NitT/TauT family transport system ATP-binding protein [Rhodococcus kyotonensis]
MADTGSGLAVRDSVAQLVDCSVVFPDTGSGAYTAVRDINLSIQRGKLVTVVGPTGSGKSTILNMVAGLLQPASGMVFSNGTTLNGLNTSAGYLFQRDTLLPWRKAVDNVALSLDYRGANRRESRELARDWLRKVGLAGFEDRYPSQLSGGQRRRVSLAQMWITDPDLILMDEPFSSLDAQTRLIMQQEVLRVWQTSGAGALFITHDLDEAVALSDEIYVLSAGPASTFAGRFDVPIERPRDLLDIKQSPEYQQIYEEVWSCLKKEVLHTYSSTSA